MAFLGNGSRIVWLLLVASPLLGQKHAAGTALPTTRTPIVALLGASVTAGYAGLPFTGGDERSRTVPLQKAVAGFWSDGRVSVRDRSDMATFIDPLGKQGRRVRRVLNEHPDLVLAIDFMFWFGYGRVVGEERKSRLAQQEVGFELLAEIDCPILLGDYPDMRDADARVLPPSAVPSPEILSELNQRLAAFVVEHANIHIFPLAEWVEHALNEDQVIEHGGRKLRVAPFGLLQRDRLHANRLGMAMLGLRIAEQLMQILPAESPLRPLDVTLEGMVLRCRAEMEIEELELVERDVSTVNK